MRTRAGVLALIAFTVGFWISAWILESRLSHPEDAGIKPNNTDKDPSGSKTVVQSQTGPSHDAQSSAAPMPARLTWIDEGTNPAHTIGDPSNPGLASAPQAPTSMGLTDEEEKAIVTALKMVDRSMCLRPSIPIERLRHSFNRETMNVLMETLVQDATYRYACIDALCGMYSTAGFEEIPAFFEAKAGSLDATSLRLLIVWFPKPELLRTVLPLALLHEDARVRAASLRRVRDDPALYQLTPGPIGHALELEQSSSLVREVLDALSTSR